MKITNFIAKSFPIIASFTFLLFSLPNILKAQNQNLEETQWEGPPITYNTLYGLGTLQSIYSFSKQGKVILKFIAIQNAGTTDGSKINSPTYNPMGNENPNERAVVSTPVGVGVSEAIGKYNLKGNSLSIEFSDSSITAIIDGNGMVGEMIYKNTNKKEKWTARKISSVEKSLSPKVSLNEFNKAFNSALDNFDKEKYLQAVVDFTEVIRLCSIAKTSYDESKDPYIKTKLSAEEAIKQAIDERENKDFLEWREKRHLFLLADSILPVAYLKRGLAKEKLWNKSGACEDFRESCKLGNKEACEKVKQSCK